MRDAGVQVRSPLRASQTGVRRRVVGPALEELRAESAACNMADIPRIIGYGILLLAALLIVVGSVTA
jgi:hypothetical protein